MDKITELEVTGECDDGLIFFVEYEEVHETERGTVTTTEFDSITLDREEALGLVDNVQSIINREKVEPDEKTKLSEMESHGKRFKLFIEDYEFPDDIELDSTAPFLTDTYELGMSHRDGAEMKKNLTYQIREVDGCAFELKADAPRCVSYISLLDVVERDEPRDEGWFTLEPGSYRVWEEVEEI